MTRPLVANLTLTLRPVIERPEETWQKPDRNPVRVLVMGLFGLWVVAMLALAVAAQQGWVPL